MCVCVCVRACVCVCVVGGEDVTCEEVEGLRFSSLVTNYYGVKCTLFHCLTIKAVMLVPCTNHETSGKALQHVAILYYL